MPPNRTTLVLLALASGVDVDSLTNAHSGRIRDPRTGQEMDLSEINFGQLTHKDLMIIVKQLQGPVHPRRIEPRGSHLTS